MVENEQLKVNWLYGAYVPKDVPLLSLTSEQRLKLYTRQSFTTPGIYLKIGLFTVTRYDRCRCSGFWPRTGHAFLRKVVTYNSAEAHYRPQIAPYGAALKAGMISGTWKPRHEVWPEGYRGDMTQAGFGIRQLDRRIRARDRAHCAT